MAIGNVKRVCACLEYPRGKSVTVCAISRGIKAAGRRVIARPPIAPKVRRFNIGTPLA